MKSKEIKYQEAVERNLWNANKYRGQKYVGKSMEQAKQSLGIRDRDSQYDEQVVKLINTLNKDTI